MPGTVTPSSTPDSEGQVFVVGPSGRGLAGKPDLHEAGNV